MEVSVVAPVYNEEACVEELYRRIRQGVSAFPGSEIVLVDDGSTDRSFEILRNLADQDPSLKVVRFTKNFGQSAAMMAGIQKAEKPVIVTMDADLQNDPADIPVVVGKLQEGFDLVCGWRKNRQDKFVTRKIPSWLANRLISWFCGVHLHDFGCTLRAYRAEVIQRIPLYGEMHRFIPALVVREGGKVTELPVQHHSRKTGKSKYGLERVLKVLLDLFLLKFLSGYSTRPIHFFGFFGLGALGIAGLSALATAFQFFSGAEWATTTFLLLTVVLGLFGVMILLIGLLAELSVRIYFEAGRKPTYVVKEALNEGPVRERTQPVATSTLETHPERSL